MSSRQEDTSPAKPDGWGEIFKGRLGVTTLTLNLGVLLFAIDTFVVATLMPTVVAEIGGLRYYSWSFSLFAAGSIIGAASAGPVNDTFGRRNAYAGAGLIFVIGLVGAALAPSMLALVAWRFVQGVGGGAISAQAYGMVGVMYPEHLRGRILALVSSVWGIATIFGPGFGGIFAELGQWRGAFAGIAVLAGVFTILAWRYVSQGEPHGRLSAIPYRRLTMLALSVLALSMTSQFESNLTRGGFVVLSAFLAAFAFIRDSKAEIRMYPRQVLVLTGELGAIYWMILLITVVLTFVNVYATLYLQVLHGVTPLGAAYLYAILSLSWTVGALVVAPWRGWLADAAIPLGLLTILIGCTGVARYVVEGPVVVIASFLAVIGIGIGFCNNPLIQRAIATAPPEDNPIAGTSVQSMRTLGISFGAAAAGMIAAAAGLTGEPAIDTVTRAVQWVYGVNVVIAVLTVAMLIPLFADQPHGRTERMR